MNRLLKSITVMFCLFCVTHKVRSATQYYLDANGSLPGSGVTNNGVYDGGGTNWTTDVTGSSVTSSDQTVNHGGTLVFSAGTDASGISYTVTGNVSQTQGGIRVQDGNVNFIATGSFFGGGTIQTLPGTSLNFAPSSWDFYGQNMIFDAAAGSIITLNAVTTVSTRTGGVIKTNAGLLIITGAATARVVVANVNSGELRLAHGNGLSTASFATNIIVSSGGSLELSNNIAVTNNLLFLNGAGFNNLGALRNISGSNNYNTLVMLASDSRINADANTLLTLNPTATNAVNGAFGLALGGDGQIVVMQPIAEVTSLTKDGNGMVTITASNAFAGPTIISNGVMRIVNGSVAGDILNNATLVISNSSAQALTNSLAGNGQLMKQSSSRLTLTATNSYSGSLLVNAGTLALATNASVAKASLISVTNGAVFDTSAAGGFTLNTGQTMAGLGVITGAVTAVSGSQIWPGFGSVAGTLTFSNTLTLAGGVTNLFNLSLATNGANDQLFVAGDFVYNGTNTFALVYTVLTNGSYPLIRTVGGNVRGNVATLQLAGFISGAQVASLATNPAGTEIDLVVAPNSHASANLAWSGNGGNNIWDLTNTVAWLNASMPATFYEGDAVAFDDSGATNPLVNLGASLAPGALTVSAHSNYTFVGNGSLFGPVSLLKSNSGALTILTTNSFSGGTLIAGGVVEINNALALGAGGVTNNAALVFNSTSTLTFTNFIAGAGTLTNLGGTLVLAASNNFYGAAVVSAGTLEIGNPFALGGIGGGALIGSGAALDLKGYALGAEPVTLAGGVLMNSSASAASLAGAVTVAASSVISGTGDIVLSGGLNGNFALTKSGINTLTLSGTGNLSGATIISNGTLLANGTTGSGSITIACGGTLGGAGVVGGAVTNQSGGTISFGTNISKLIIDNSLSLNPGSSTILKVGRVVGGTVNDSLAGIATFTLGGALTISLAGYPVQAGDSFQIFSATNVHGAFNSVSLPWLYTGLVWDTSSLSNGVLRVIALPGISSFAQRHEWTIQQAAENPGAVGDGFVQAEVYFAQGRIALGQSTALAASRSLTNNVQVDFFNIWPAMDCYVRFNQFLDLETRSNIKTNVTTCTQYAGTSTANLYTLGHVIRYLGSEQFGEAAFAPNAIWRTNDPNAYLDTLALLGRDATNGYGEHGSRPYYDKNLLPILTLAQLATNHVVASRAMLAFQAGLSQNAGCWMRGHLGVNTGRSYPDEETQTPMGSMRTLWVFFGGDTPPDNYTYAALAAVMNYEPLPVIQMAATNRGLPYVSRGGYYGAQQNSFADHDYILFTEGPEYYGNFQVYPSGAMWCDPDDNHFSQLWLCAPWNDDPAVVSGSWPHGMNRAIYSEAQCRDAMLQIYNFSSGQTNPPPYALCYVPGGWQAAINDSLAKGKIFLHYGTVLLAISCDQTFKWDTNSGIYAVSQSPTRTGDSEFRIWGQPVPAFMQVVTNLANSYPGTWTNQFAVAMETSRPDLYPGVTPAEQLAAFRADIYAHTGLGHAAGNPPTGFYTNRHGDTLQVKQTSTLTPSPVVINGQTLNFTNWPLTDNPWIYQLPGGNLSLWDGLQTIVYDFNAWTITTNSSAAPPSELLASANSNGVYLSWSPRFDVTSYNVKRASSSGGNYTLVGTTTNDSFFDSTVVSAMNYFYVVSASSHLGESTNSNEAAVITLPAAPTGLNAPRTGRVVNLSWNPVASATGYNLKRATSAVGNFMTVAMMTNTNAVDQSFPVGGNYFYAVSAINPAGEGSNSTVVAVGVPLNYFASWSNRCTIAFPNYKSSEVLSNFPALVILSTNIPNFSYRQFASPLGYDLRFSDASQNELNYEVEQWNTNGDSFVWVQIPVLTDNTLIYAWWNNPAATTTPAYATNGATWRDHFVGVWHFNQTPNAAALDSSGNGFYGTPNANLNSGSQQPGICAGGIAFNGMNTAMNVSNVSALGLTAGQFTLSAWVDLNNATNGVIIGKGQNSQSWYSWFLSVGNNPGVDQVNTVNRLCVGVRGGGSSGDVLATQTSDVTLSNWVQAVGTLDGANLNLYVNGQLNATTPTAVIPYSNISQIWVGADSGRDYLNGKLDEVRVEDVSRSPAWIWACYQNVASNAGFNSYSPATALGASLKPRIMSFGFAMGQPNLLVSGVEGFAYTVQISTNLVYWQDVFTNNPGLMPASWIDNANGPYTRCFYRVVLKP